MTDVTKKARQIALLLELANHPKTPPDEADAARLKADHLMLRYRIEAAEAEEAQPEQAKPEWSDVYVCRDESEWSHFYSLLVREVAKHTGVLGVLVAGTGEDGFRWRVFRAVGFKADLEMFEMQWASTMIEFQRRFEPQYDPNLSDAINAFQMRVAGMERRRIAAVMMPGWTTLNEMKAKTRKVTKLIKQGAEELGESVDGVLGRQGASIKTHRESYASGFVYTLIHRMRNLRLQRGQESGAMVLASRKERLDEALYERYPNLRPAPVGTKVLGEERAKCPRCEKAKSGYCREHQWMKPSTARYRAGSFSGAAYERGSDAARQVDLGHGGTPTLGA